MHRSDTFGLNRFIEAQAAVYQDATRELRSGRKTSHWMWFIFPQIRGLGRSETARTYAISSLTEAQAYLSAPVLGPRLRECCEILLQGAGQSAEDIFGPTDALKLQSSMTLFREASASDTATVFQAVLDQFYGGKADKATLAILAGT